MCLTYCERGCRGKKNENKDNKFHIKRGGSNNKIDKNKLFY